MGGSILLPSNSTPQTARGRGGGKVGGARF